MTSVWQTFAFYYFIRNNILLKLVLKNGLKEVSHLIKTKTFYGNEAHWFVRTSFQEMSTSSCCSSLFSHLFKLYDILNMVLQSRQALFLSDFTGYRESNSKFI